MKNKKLEIELCLNVIERYFTFLKILGTGFMTILGVHSIIKDIFGIIIAKATLIVVALSIVITILTIFRKFAIIKTIREKDELCK